ncbi:hypothetical protein Ctu_1p00340 (plasmid) [Cronobacter turicensis z3032]|uniref:Uncharacterized protein n=1 Tax=Cronobacter turicensis (strain DSM 18703 / CCUG 55852 / LMG 23827 / z3032) TaxID=693216 RepID=C9Y5C6_CROTZ|nr:hypothetical protein Ctu_1p00340 [Cronobacter turicensis z3032]
MIPRLLILLSYLSLRRFYVRRDCSRADEAREGQVMSV